MWCDWLVMRLLLLVVGASLLKCGEVVDSEREAVAIVASFNPINFS